MIVVAGEALMDVLVGQSGTLVRHPGGAPFNVARAIGRLGAQARFLGRLSSDQFGDELHAALGADGADLIVAERVPEPTTLAIAQVSTDGMADYRFYLEGTSAVQLRPPDVAPDVLEGAAVLVLGGLGIAIEPIASTLRGLVAGAPPGVHVVLDPNCRSRAIRDFAAYRAMVLQLTRHVSIVKVSADDLQVLSPGVEASTAARSLLSLGPAALLLTDGPRPVVIHTASGERAVPVPDVPVVDTVGAGDAFVAGIATWIAHHRPGRGDLSDLGVLTEATRAAARVASAACTVAGANVPRALDWDPWDPSTAGAIQGVAPDVTPESVERALR